MKHSRFKRTLILYRKNNNFLNLEKRMKKYSDGVRYFVLCHRSSHINAWIADNIEEARLYSEK